MFDTFIENIQVVGPVFAFVWILTIVLTVWRPQMYFNSILLIIAIFVTMIFLGGFFGDGAGVFLLVCFIIVMIALFLVPVMLIINGVVMIKNESVCAAHLLSLGLGIFVGIGEIATVLYVLGLSGFAGFESLGLWNLFLVFTVFYFSCLVLSFVIYSVFIQHMPHRMTFNYVIIHGAGLAGGETLTKLLSNRVDKAIDIYEKCKVKPMIICSVMHARRSSPAVYPVACRSPIFCMLSSMKFFIEKCMIMIDMTISMTVKISTIEHAILEMLVVATLMMLRSTVVKGISPGNTS